MSTGRVGPMNMPNQAMVRPRTMKKRTRAGREKVITFTVSQKSLKVYTNIQKKECIKGVCLLFFSLTTGSSLAKETRT